MKNKTLIWGDSKTISSLVGSLKNNQVCAGSTDTVLGLLASTTEQGFHQLNEIKLRSLKSYIVLVNSLEKLHFFVDIDYKNQKLMKLVNEIWPGPVTLIFKSNKNLPGYLKSLDNSIAIRIPNHAGLLQLLTFFDGLFSTSANLSGQRVPESINEMDLSIRNSVEYIIGDNLDENYRYPVIPSTILDFTKEKVKVIREGVIAIDKLEQIYGEKFEK